MAPLAGRPPYATDLPDSHYNQPPQPRRPREQPPADPNSRSSAYDVYDSYFDSKDRNSGVDAVGLGFLNGDVDDDSDDEGHDEKKPSSKHAALAAATAVNRRASPTLTPPPQYNIAAPKPGYAAPIAALNLARPEPAADGRPTYNSPSPMSVSTPHPLDPPLSPITPAFARPRPPKSDVKFSFPEKSIMRGDTEETLLPKRGERGDDFWRRFSMVAKQESTKSPNHKTSAWLRKTQNGKNRLAVWVWVVGVVLILAAAGGIGLGWYFSHNSPSHQQPTAFGGSADQSQSPSSSTVKSVGTGSAGVKTSLHVSPTNTVARRALEPRITGYPAAHRRHFGH